MSTMRLRAEVVAVLFLFAGSAYIALHAIAWAAGVLQSALPTS